MQHNAHLELDPHGIVQLLPLSEGPAVDRVVIDDTRFLFTAHFQKSGPDLVLTDGVKKLVLVDYFRLEKHPDLVSADGAIMSADLVERLAGPHAPGQYAQAGAPAGAQVIGRVELASGSTSVQHANGVVDIVKAGDALLKGDVVMTGEGAGLTLSLIDGTALNMGASARMVLAELTYDSNSPSNSAVLTATLLEDPNGGSGRYDVSDPVTGVVLHTITSTSTQVAFTPAPNQVLVRESAKSPAIVQQELAVAQILFPVFLANPANAQPTQPSPPNNSLTPPQDQPQPPQETASNNAAAINTIAIVTTADTKAAQTGPGSQLIVTGPSGGTGPATSALSISIATVVGNDIVNLSKAQAGFAISGAESGADGQAVTVAILDASGRIVDSYTTVAAGGSWSVNVRASDATALRDGTYTVTASVSNAAGNPASVTQSVLVDQTPPTITIAAIAGDSNINLATAMTAPDCHLRTRLPTVTIPKAPIPAGMSPGRGQLST